MTIYIVVSAILFALLFSLMIYFSKSILLKLLTVAIVFVMANQIYFGFESMKGWPTEVKMSGKGQLIWTMVVEQSDTYSGAIYMWVYLPEPNNTWYEKYITYHTDATAPRSLKMPYNEKLAEQLNKVKKSMEEGYTVEIDFDAGQSAEQIDGSGESGDGEAPSTDGSNANESGKIDKNIPRLKLIDPRTNGLRKD